MFSAIMRNIQGNEEKMTRRGDRTLDHEFMFPVFTRRHHTYNRYRIKRTVDGWSAGHISINDPCEKDGAGALTAAVQRLR